MILLMERTARAVIDPYLEAGEISVGVSVQVQHVAGTPIGATVVGEAVVSRLEGKLVHFEIVARDEVEVLGRGTHCRAVVGVSKVRQRLLEKQTKLTSGIVLPMLLDQASGPIANLPTIRVERTGAILQATLDRPQQLNAINSQMTSDWETLVAWLAKHTDDVRVVIISSQGNAFCAGADIIQLGGHSFEEATAISHRQARMFLAIESLPQVFIAAVHGPALGGGCVMACSCDFRIAASNATFAMPEVGLGWPPGYGIAQLTSIIGKSRAIDLCLTGRTLNANDAAEIGLVHRVVPGGQLAAAALSMAKKLLSMPRQALSETKRLVHAHQGEWIKSTYLADTAAYIRCLSTQDAREGLIAFQEKRPPKRP
jgi:enoyl-CoA hydratase/carnithine racemase/predicted thioesterase